MGDFINPYGTSRYGAKSSMSIPRGSSLEKGLVAYYSLSSGAPTVGATTLEDYGGSASYGAGKNGNCAQFTQAAGWRLRALTGVAPTPYPANEITVAFWWNPTTTGTYDFGKRDNGGSGNREWYASYIGTKMVRFGTFAEKGAGGGSFPAATWSGYAVGSWCLFIGRVVAGKGYGECKVNGDAWQSGGAYTGGVWKSVATGVADANFYIGGSATSAANCKMDEFMLWNRGISDAEALELYDEGRGKYHPF